MMGATGGLGVQGTYNKEMLAERLAEEIRAQEPLHSSLLKDLAKIAASPAVDEDDFHATFLKALGKSGLETRLQNAVFHLLRTKPPEQWVTQNDLEVKKREPLDYMIKIQAQWERRILKSLNSMCSELGLCLAKPRCQDEQNEFLNKWNELSTLDIDLTHFRPVYAPKDFLDILAQVHSPNMNNGGGNAATSVASLAASALMVPSSSSSGSLASMAMQQPIQAAPGAGLGDLQPAGGLAVGGGAKAVGAVQDAAGLPSSNRAGLGTAKSPTVPPGQVVPKQQTAMTVLPAQVGFARPWGMIGVPFKVPTIEQLREKFSELARAEPHLGLNPQAQSLEDPTISLETERYNLGNKVLAANHAPMSQEFLKKGAPHCLRGKLWYQVLGCVSCSETDTFEMSPSSIKQTKEALYFESLKDAVIRNDVMVDKLIIKDVELTAANDDNYFVFEDFILQVLLCFSRDTGVLEKFRTSCSTAARATLRGRTLSNVLENSVIYPPNGIVPFHGFAMYCAPFCYVYDDPVQLYFAFRAFYLQFTSKLHEVSSEPQGIVSLCALFEHLLMTHEPDLWTHFVSHDIQPLRLVFRWMMRGFSGHLLPEQLLHLWDLVIAYDSMEVFPLLAAAIMSFRRENLLCINTLSAAESVLADLSSLPVIPLLQLALEKSRGRSSLGPFRKISQGT